MRRDDPYDLQTREPAWLGSGHAGDWYVPLLEDPEDSPARKAYLAELAERDSRRIPIGFQPVEETTA